MYRRNLSNYKTMNIVYTTDEGNQLWLGDYYAATNHSLLKQKNITSVLTVAAMLGVKYPKDGTINHKVIPAYDIPTYKMTPHFDEANQFIKSALARGNILVHCAAGISRSTTCVLVYLMTEKGQSFKQAFSIVKARRPIVNPNYGFQEELAKYDKVLKKNPDDKPKTISNLPPHQAEMKQQKNEEKEDIRMVARTFNNNRYFSNIGNYMKPAGKPSALRTSSALKNSIPDQSKRGSSLNYRFTLTNNILPTDLPKSLTYKIPPRK